MTAPPGAFETEDFLEVGLAAILVTHFQRTEPVKSMTAVRGWRAGKFVLIDRPRTKEGAEAIVAIATACKIRLISNGQACEFDSKVMDIDTGTPNGELRLRWPSTVRRTAFRKFERVTVKSPCTAKLEGGPNIEGQMLDVSIGGFSFLTKQEFSTDVEIRITFTLPDGAHISGANAVIRSTNVTDNGILVGCQFSPDQTMVENEVAYFVSTWLHQFRSHGAIAPPARILLVDDAGGAVEKLHRAFQGAGVETLLASNAIDAAYRIRVSHPLGIVINAALDTLDSDAFMNVLARGPKEYCLPIYVSKDGEVTRVATNHDGAAQAPFKTAAEDAKAVTQAILKDLNVANA